MSKTLQGGGPDTDITSAQVKAAEAALEREQQAAEVPAEVDPHDDRTKEFTHVGFSRMRTDWHGTDGQMMRSIATQADNALLVAFADAYRILNDIYTQVREQAVDHQTGQLLTDEHDWPVWKRNEWGGFVEDYTQLGIKQREEFLFQITVRLVEWEQQAADSWGEAMFAKAVWEEQFSTSFFAPGEGRKTDEAMTQRGRLGSRDERYFALYRSVISRKADALVRSMERVSLRLSQSLGK